MQNDVIAKIDLLVKMSDSSSNISTLKVELREIESAIKEKKLELKEIKLSISDDKYFDASSEIVDKNIEISLTKRIEKLKKSLEDIENQLLKMTNEESKYFSEIDSLQKELKESENFRKILNTKMLSSINKDNNFEALFKEIESRIKSLKKELNDNQKNYEKIQGKLEVLTFSKNELKSKIDSENEKLIDIKANLVNKRGYINSQLKKEDQENIESLEKTIEMLENSKTQILKDPVMIAEEAKNFLIDDDKTSALNKVRELRNIILEQPYMDVDSQSVSSLLIELENAEAKRDEFASMINSKNYESVDTTLIKDRIIYITDQKEQLEKEIKEIEEKIEQIDNNKLEDLNNRINYCENEVGNLKEKLSEYENTLNNEDISVVKKASLQASFDKKQDELNHVLELLSSYKNDRKNLIIESYNLGTNNIEKIKEEIKKINSEIRSLEKLSISTIKSKDTIAMENDKKTLKELNDNIKAIKKRQSLKNTPSELYDEIEMLLGIDYSLEEIDSKNEIEGTNFLNKNIENIPNNPSVSMSNHKEHDDTLSVISDEDLNLEVIDINDIEEEKIKVIAIEPISKEENSSNNSINNDFLIGDYKSEE